MSNVRCGFETKGPTVTDFYSDVSYGTRQSYEAITSLAKETAKALTSVKTTLTPVLKTGREVLRDLGQREFICSVDQERKLISNYLDAEHELYDVYNQLMEQEDSAVRDPKLNSNNEKTVLTAYRTTIKKVKELIKVTQSIRWEIMSHAEDYDEVVGEATSVEELISALS